MANKRLFQSALPGATLPDTDAVNAAGGRAYARSDKATLAQYAVTGCLASTYYSKDEDQLKITLELAEKVDSQFLAQETAACFVLGQGFAAPVTQRQQSHQLPVGLLSPGLQFHLSPGVLEGTLDFALILVPVAQAAQGLQGQALQPLPLEQRPLLKGGAAGKGEACQEITAIQFDGLLQLVDSLLVCWLIGSQEVGEG